MSTDSKKELHDHGLAYVVVRLTANGENHTWIDEHGHLSGVFDEHSCVICTTVFDSIGSSYEYIVEKVGEENIEYDEHYLVGTCPETKEKYVQDVTFMYSRDPRPLRLLHSTFRKDFDQSIRDIVVRQAEELYKYSGVIYSHTKCLEKLDDLKRFVAIYPELKYPLNMIKNSLIQRGK